jgi:uncharacterized protein (DUF885 family)
LRRKQSAGEVTVVVLVVLAFMGAWTSNLVWGKPGNIDHFFERTFIRQLISSPEFMTHIGILEPYGINFHNSKLDDPSEAFQERQMALLKSELAVLRSYDRAALTPSQQLSRDIADYFFEVRVEGEPWRWHDYPVNQLFGAQSEKPAFMMNIHPVRSVADADRYNDRLERFADYFDALTVGLEKREKLGIVPPRFVIERVLTQMRGFIAPAPRDHPLYTALKNKLAKVPGGETVTGDILKRTEAAIESSVYPAYRRLIAYHEHLLAHATNDDGVWKLPDGDRYYAYLLRENTTTDLTPEEVHQLGLREVARIERELEAAFAAIGMKEGTLRARMEALGRDPRQLYPDNSAQTRERVVADYNAILEEVDRRMDSVFSVRPKSGFEVRAVEPFREKTSAAAFYTPGTLDGSRKGIFYVNTRDVPGEIPKFSMKTLAYHEAIPGHYFQGAIAQQLQGVPTFRLIIPFTAYQEGWGLYSERLAWEMGLYKDDPAGYIGRLRDEMLRATRLVVDTGIHYKHWTREKAIAYMLEKYGGAEGEITAEVERYIVSPGQACAYKVGELKILELRERTRQKLGARFDIRRFHSVVLENGALPLAILEQLVDRFIAEESARA